MPAPALVTQDLSEVKANWLVVAVSEAAEFSPAISALDDALGGTLRRLRERKDIQGKPGELTVLPDAPGIQADRVIVLGLGKSDDITLLRWERAVLSAARKASETEDASLAIALPDEVVDKLGLDETVQMAAYALQVGAAGQGIYKKEPDRHLFRETLLVTTTAPTKEASAALERGQILGEAVNLTRELVNRHPEEITPKEFASRAQTAVQGLDLQIDILDEEQLKTERMNALLAVARGSAHAPRVVMLTYQGAGDGAPHLALCGKGVTFDSGGLSIKPTDGMIGMKADMAGAATVLGAMTAIARLKLPVNVIGLMGLAENMLGPHSYKLGEVLTARNGVTIEVHNTDAEGRLVLADVLSYAADKKPRRMIDLATLTGACVVALGPDFAGAFTNQQSWCDDVLAAARQTGELLWQLPMDDSFNEQLKCDFADVKNVGTRWGGAITAAKFLERFVNEIPWVHLDIAGPSYAESAKAYRDVGGTGSSVRTLVAAAAAIGETSGN